MQSYLASRIILLFASQIERSFHTSLRTFGQRILSIKTRLPTPRMLQNEAEEEQTERCRQSRSINWTQWTDGRTRRTYTKARFTLARTDAKDPGACLGLGIWRQRKGGIKLNCQFTKSLIRQSGHIVDARLTLKRTFLAFTDIRTGLWWVLKVTSLSFFPFKTTVFGTPFKWQTGNLSYPMYATRCLI